MTESGGEYTDETEQWVDIDIYADDTRVERLTLKEGDDFEAEVHCDNWRMEVVGFRTVDADTHRSDAE